MLTDYKNEWKNMEMWNCMIFSTLEKVEHNVI